MRTLVLMRHGDAPNFSDSGEVIEDFQRALSEKGKTETIISANALKSQYTIDLIIASHAPRSCNTAKFLLERFPDAFFRQEEVIYDGNSQLIKRFIWSIEDDFNTICIIGHNPTISSIARDFSKGEFTGTLKPSEFIITTQEY